MRPKSLEREWWWRTVDRTNFWWKNGIESATYNYELVRRLDRTRRMPPWNKLDPVLQEKVKAKVGKTSLEWVAEVFQHIRDTDGSGLASRINPRKGWSSPIRFNLSASNTALHWNLDRFIKLERTLQRNKVRSHAHHGARNSCSWRWIEAWDKSELVGEVLTDSGRTMKSNAKKRAREFEKAVLAALDEKSFKPHKRQ